MTHFKPHHWPPGRACKPTRNGMKYEIILYKGEHGDFPQEFRALTEKLSKTIKTQLQGIIVSTIRDAGLGRLTPVSKDGYANRSGEVEQLITGGKKILEIRLEHRFDPPKELLKGKRLRLYFCEPQYPEWIVFLLIEPKTKLGNWKTRQNAHISQAVKRADDWWAKNH